MGGINSRVSRETRPKIQLLTDMQLELKEEDDDKVDIQVSDGVQVTDGVQILHGVQILDSVGVGEWLLAVDRVTHIPGKCQHQILTPADTSETSHTAVPRPSDEGSNDSDDNAPSTPLLAENNCGLLTMPPRHDNCSCAYCSNTTGVYEVAVAIVTWVHKRVVAQFPDIEFEIMPTGSFPRDVKVLENSEFDFLLVFTQCVHNDRGFVESHRIFDFFEQWFEHLQWRKGVRVPTAYPGITAVYKHGPSWCIEMAWQSEHRTNTLSIDITLGVRHVGEALKSRCSSLENTFLFANIYNNILENAIFVNSDRHRCAVALCVLDERMFAQIQTVSPHVLPTYRLMKVFISLLFPKRVKFCKFTARGFTAAPYVSSHELKNLLYRQVEQYHNAEDWEVDQLPQRIVGMLKSLHQRECELELQEFIHDVNTSRELRTYSWLIDHISRGYNSHQETTESSCPEEDVSLKVSSCDEGSVGDEAISAEDEDDNQQKVDDCKDFFAYVKERDYKRIHRVEDLQHLLEDTQSRDRSACLVYFRDNPLLAKTGVKNKPKLCTLLSSCHDYLRRKFADIPDMDIHDKLSLVNLKVYQHFCGLIHNVSGTHTRRASQQYAKTGNLV